MEVGKEKKECENPNLDSNPNPNPNPDSNPNPNPNPNPLTYPDPFEPTSTWGQAGVGSPAVGPPGSSSVPGSRPLPTGMYCTLQQLPRYTTSGPPWLPGPVEREGGAPPKAEAEQPPFEPPRCCSDLTGMNFAPQTPDE